MTFAPHILDHSTTKGRVQVDSIQIILSALAFALVISVDTLAAGFSYGTSNTRVPLRNLTVIDVICSALLGTALFVGLHLSVVFSSSATKILSAGILVSIGTYKLAASLCVKQAHTPKHARQIKWTETLILGGVLALDGMAVGLGASIHSASVAFCITVIAFSLVTDFVFFRVGQNLGRKITKKTRLDLSWLGGIVLVILGVVKLL